MPLAHAYTQRKIAQNIFWKCGLVFRIYSENLEIRIYPEKYAEYILKFTNQSIFWKIFQVIFWKSEFRIYSDLFSEYNLKFISLIWQKFSSLKIRIYFEKFNFQDILGFFFQDFSILKIKIWWIWWKNNENQDIFRNKT